MAVLSISATAQVVINNPTNDSIIYTGDQIDIKWTPRTNGASFVTISLQDESSGTLDWIAFAIPNNGLFQWNAHKWATANTQFQLAISDGGSSLNRTAIHITIPNGPRPKSVAATIRKVVSVEWVADPTHSYRVESSTNLTSWVTVAEGVAGVTNPVSLYYADWGSTYFRVFDTTP